MGFFDQIVNGLNNKIAASANKIIHEITNESPKEQTPLAAKQNPLHIAELDGILDREKVHYQTFKSQCVEQYRYTFFVDKAFTQLIQNHSFEMIDQMPEDLRQSEYCKQKLADLLDHHMRVCRKCYTDHWGSVTIMHNLLKELTYFPEIADSTKELLCNEAYFSSEQSASRSVLHFDMPIKEQFERILSAGLPSCIRKIATYEALNYEILEKKQINGKALSDSDINVCVVNNAILCGMTVDELDQLKQMVLYLALSDDRSHDALNANDLVNKVVVFAFGITTTDEEVPALNPGVDFVIADAIRSVKSGNIEEFNERLQGWLNVCGREIAVDQYKVFQAVFKEIGAYSSECVLLDYVIHEEIEHSVAQEKRHSFLKENKNLLSQDMTKFSPVIINSTKVVENTGSTSQVLIYDHRFLSWNTSDIEKYFKGLLISGELQKVAAVVDKWSKNVTIDSQKWDNTTITQLINETISLEFDLDYEVTAVNAGVIIDDEIDTTPAVYIKATEEARYQNLSFLIIGEPMTKNQVNLSILVIATPEMNANSNDKIMKQIIAIKEKHNPRLETYIETFKSIVIEKINNWVIQTTGTQDIY